MIDPVPDFRRRVRGFTLVESLVAFAILALTFAAVMQSFSGGLRILAATQSHTEATRIAENRLAEAGRASPLLPGTSEGEQGRYRWRIDVVPYEDGRHLDGAYLPPAYRVTVTVSWGGNRRVTLATVKFGEPVNE